MSSTGTDPLPVPCSAGADLNCAAASSYPEAAHNLPARASKGVWVSAHPDVILKMDVKEVLHRTRHLGWGVDTQLYRNAAALPRH